MGQAADTFGQAGFSVVDGTVAASAARTATESWDFENYNSSGLIVIIQSTVEVATASVVFTINGIRPDGTIWTILTSAAVTDNATTLVLRVSPNLTASANLIAQDLVPRRIRITATHADADALTYSIHAFLTA